MFVFQDSAVFQRTVKGQREAISPTLGISNEARSLMLLVNGYTSCGAFAQLLCGRSYLTEELNELVDAGLIALVPVVKAMGSAASVARAVSWSSAEPVRIAAPA